MKTASKQFAAFLKRLFEAWQREGLWRVIVSGFRAWRRKLDRPAPWPQELDRRIHEPDAVPVCHRCFFPLADERRLWFCPECGVAIGPYNNLMPFINIFSIGEVLRSGTARNARYSLLRLAGYLAACFSQYILFFPFYVIRICWNLRQRMKRAQDMGANDNMVKFRRALWMTLTASALLLVGLAAILRAGLGSAGSGYINSDDIGEVEGMGADDRTWTTNGRPLHFQRSAPVPVMEGPPRFYRVTLPSPY